MGEWGGGVGEIFCMGFGNLELGNFEIEFRKRY